MQGGGVQGRQVEDSGRGEAIESTLPSSARGALPICTDPFLPCDLLVLVPALKNLLNRDRVEQGLWNGAAQMRRLARPLQSWGDAGLPTTSWRGVMSDE